MAELFEYSIILNEKRDKEGDILEEAEVVVPVTAVLAKDENQAQMIAARKIPEEYMNGKLDRLVVVVRPF